MAFLKDCVDIQHTAKSIHYCKDFFFFFILASVIFRTCSVDFNKMGTLSQAVNISMKRWMFHFSRKYNDIHLNETWCYQYLFLSSFFKFKLNQQTADSNLYNTHLKRLIIHNSSLKSLLLENKLSDYLTSSGRLEELFPILLRKKFLFTIENVSINFRLH